jgi:hypothetical protein
MVVARARSYDRLMTRRDVATLALLGFFFAVAVTIELYYVVAHGELVAAAAAGNVLARGLALYGPSDSAYFAAPTALTLSLEGINVFVTQLLGIALAYAIVRRRPWRWPLQLALGSYVAYSVVLYFTEGAVSGFANMSERSAGTFAIYIGANLPWLVGAAWMAASAAREIARRLAPAIVERDRIAAVVEDVGEEPAEIEPRRERGDHGQSPEPLAP